jgi:hypothetical protein
VTTWNLALVEAIEAFLTTYGPDLEHIEDVKYVKQVRLIRLVNLVRLAKRVKYARHDKQVLGCRYRIAKQPLPAVVKPPGNLAVSLKRRRPSFQRDPREWPMPKQASHTYPWVTSEAPGLGGPCHNARSQVTRWLGAAGGYCTGQAHACLSNGRVSAVGRTTREDRY